VHGILEYRRSVFWQLSATLFLLWRQNQSEDGLERVGFGEEVSVYAVNCELRNQLHVGERIHFRPRVLACYNRDTTLAKSMI